MNEVEESFDPAQVALELLGALTVQMGGEVRITSESLEKAEGNNLSFEYLPMQDVYLVRIESPNE